MVGVRFAIYDAGSATYNVVVANPVGPYGVQGTWQCGRSSEKEKL
jgi:hypothetical protein